MADWFHQVMKETTLVGICTTNEASGFGPVLYGLGSDGSLWCGTHTVTTDGVPSQVEWTRLSTPFDGNDSGLGELDRASLLALLDELDDQVFETGHSETRMHRIAQDIRRIVEGGGE